MIKLRESEFALQAFNQNQESTIQILLPDGDYLISFGEIKKLLDAESEVQRLKEENAEWERWNTRCRHTKEEWGRKLTETESRLAKAQELVKKWRDKKNDLHVDHGNGYHTKYTPVTDGHTLQCADELEAALGNMDKTDRCDTCGEVSKKSCLQCGSGAGGEDEKN